MQQHVVGAGPFWGHCIFDNHEEVRMPRLYEYENANDIKG
jgi:hypothetical protein